jgi:DNA polymerase-3 subunit delta'
MAFTADAALDLLRQAHAQERLAHGYLITGGTGSGKRELAKGLCTIVHGATAEPFQHQDVHLVEPESKSRRIVITQIRELEHSLHMRSLSGARKVGIIFDADRLVEAASNAFLKTLEEPPQNSLLLLLSSLPEVLPDTILSRCIEVPLQTVGRRACSACEARLLEALQSYSRSQVAGCRRSLAW